LKTLADVDRTIGNDVEKGPIEPELLNDKERSSDVPPATSQPSPFLLQTLAGIIDKGVKLSRAAGWQGPGVEGVFSEEEWKQSVTTYSAIVIQKRWPTLANETTPEMALLLLMLPWALWALPQLFKLLVKRKVPKDDGTRHSDSGGNGDGKNNAHEETAEPVPAGLPH
jgi:hypothetical protein